jgi:metal-dependent amidase/aminoacylase/carboxypeptidase family protein
VKKVQRRTCRTRTAYGNDTDEYESRHVSSVFACQTTDSTKKAERETLDGRLLCAAKMITKINECALSTPGSLASVAVINSGPHSINTLAGKVQFNIDARAKSDEILAELEEKIERECKKLAEQEGVQMAKWERIWKCPRVYFDEDVIECFRKSTAEVSGQVREMQSGAGHDSVYASTKVPTAMLFIRCKGGEWLELA